MCIGAELERGLHTWKCSRSLLVAPPAGRMLSWFKHAYIRRLWRRQLHCTQVEPMCDCLGRAALLRSLKTFRAAPPLPDPL